MSAFRLGRLGSIALLTLAAAGTFGCPKRNETYVATPTGPAGAVDLDADPAALLPFGALMIANLAAKEITNSSVGGDLAQLGERLVPFAQQIDFQVKRDLDRAYVGMYAFSGADYLAILSGSFHPDKLEAEAGKGLNTPYGVVVVSTYAGRKLYTVANIGFTMLSTRTALAGTETAMRRALDRIQAGTLKREMAPWMAEWVQQPGYSVLIASDVTKQSFGKTVTNYIPWIQGVQYVRIRGRFNPDSSFGASGALTYPDPGKAQTAAQGFNQFKSSIVMMAALKYIGIDPLIRQMTVQASGNDMQFQTVIDEKQTRQMIKLLTGWASGGMPSLPAPGTPNGPIPPPPGTPGTSI